jgi:hypothetical protein
MRGVCLSIVLILGALGVYVYWDVKGLELVPGDDVVLMINDIGGCTGDPVPVSAPGRQDSREVETGTKGKLTSIFRNGDPPSAYVVLNDSSSTVEVELKYLHKIQ